MRTVHVLPSCDKILSHRVGVSLLEYGLVLGLGVAFQGLDNHHYFLTTSPYIREMLV